MSIRDWPKTERPRERLIECGPDVLSDGELLAVLIGCGNRGRSAVDLARSLIDEFGSLRDFLTAEPRKCLGQRGIGPARYASLQAALELARRHYRASLDVGQRFRCPHAVRDFLQAQLRDRPYEMFCCLYLDRRERLIAFEELFRGTVNEMKVHVREVVRQVMRHNASALICAHNHPTGSPEPSDADRFVTTRLRDTLAAIDVRLKDHLIIAGTQCLSFADHNLI